MIWDSLRNGLDNAKSSIMLEHLFNELRLFIRIIDNVKSSIMLSTKKTRAPVLWIEIVYAFDSFHIIDNAKSSIMLSTKKMRAPPL